MSADLLKKAFCKTLNERSPDIEIGHDNDPRGQLPNEFLRNYYFLMNENNIQMTDDQVKLAREHVGDRQCKRDVCWCKL